MDKLPPSNNNKDTNHTKPTWDRNIRIGNVMSSHSEVELLVTNPLAAGSRNDRDPDADDDITAFETFVTSEVRMADTAGGISSHTMLDNEAEYDSASAWNKIAAATAAKGTLIVFLTLFCFVNNTAINLTILYFLLKTSNKRTIMLKVAPALMVIIRI